MLVAWLGPRPAGTGLAGSLWDFGLAQRERERFWVRRSRSGGSRSRSPENVGLRCVARSGRAQPCTDQAGSLLSVSVNENESLLYKEGPSETGETPRQDVTLLMRKLEEMMFREGFGSTQRIASWRIASHRLTWLEIAWPHGAENIRSCTRRSQSPPESKRDPRQARRTVGEGVLLRGRGVCPPNLPKTSDAISGEARWVPAGVGWCLEGAPGTEWLEVGLDICAGRKNPQLFYQHPTRRYCLPHLVNATLGTSPYEERSSRAGVRNEAALSARCREPLRNVIYYVYYIVI